MTQPDLGALIIHLRAHHETQITRHMGRAVQAIALDAVRRHDPDLSAALHDPHGLKPYAASTLMRPDSSAPLTGQTRPGTPACIRLSGLRRDVTAAFSAFAESLPAVLEFDGQPWQVERAEWAARATYADLIRQHQNATPPRRLDLRFVSGTAFHSRAINIPLPLPTLVFNSLTQRWTECSGLPLPENLPPFIEHHLLISRHRLHSEALAFKQGSQQIAFLGEVSYTLAARSQHLAKHDPPLADALRHQHADLARALGLLVAFARSSGVGIKTGQGMGMVL